MELSLRMFVHLGILKMMENKVAEQLQALQTGTNFMMGRT